jgi:hypothetical protein
MSKIFYITKAVICYDEENYVNNYSKGMSIQNLGACISHCLIDMDAIINIIKNNSKHSDVIHFVNDEIIIYHDNMFVHIEENISHNTTIDIKNIKTM